MAEKKQGKNYSIELKQTAKKEWYVGSIRVDATSEKELSEALDKATELTLAKINSLNQKEPEEPIDAHLLMELRSLRSDLASRTGLPHYMIFSNAALEELARRKPVTKEQFVVVPGVGEMKFEKYGQSVLEVIKKHVYSKEPTSADKIEVKEEKIPPN